MHRPDDSFFKPLNYTPKHRGVARTDHLVEELQPYDARNRLSPDVLDKLNGPMDERFYKNRELTPKVNHVAHNAQMLQIDSVEKIKLSEID